MSNLWSTEELLWWYKREILVCHHRLDHCAFKFLLRISNRDIIPRKTRRVRKLSPCFSCLFGKSHKRPWSTKVKHSYGSIRKASETIPRAMTSIYQMVYAQPGLISQVTGYLTHMRLWEAAVFLYRYSNYCYAHLMRETSAEEILRAKEAYNFL